MIFNHVQIKVNDLKSSRIFYDAVMAILGCKVIIDTQDVVGYGTTVHDMFEIRQAGEEAALSQSVHISFNAADKESVDNFHSAALKNGGTCHGKPGLRPEYEEGYYAAFVIDPDGHNIEAVYSERK